MRLLAVIDMQEDFVRGVLRVPGAGNHTSIDSYEKRNQKGFLFTVGDEPTLSRISKETLTNLTGVKYERDYTWQEAYELACEKYHVFHIHVHHGGGYYDEVVKKQMK